MVYAQAASVPATRTKFSTQAQIGAVVSVSQTQLFRTIRRALAHAPGGHQRMLGITARSHAALR